MRAFLKPWELVLFLLILSGGMALRFCGLKWELPGALHYHSYHPDEFLVCASALHVAATGSLDTDFYNYGTGFIYALSSAYNLFGPLVEEPFFFGPPGLSELRATHLLGRVTSASLSSLTIVLVWVMGRLLGGPLIGLLSGASLAFAPLACALAHYATVDSAATFWVALTSLFSVLAVKRGSWRAALGAAFLSGFSGATKYSAGVVYLSALVSSLLLPQKPEQKRKIALLSFPIALLGFLLLCPGPLLAPSSFWRDFSFELRHSRMGHGLVFLGLPPAFIYHPLVNLPSTLGWPLAGTLLVGAILAGFTKSKETLPVWAFALTCFGMLSTSKLMFARYLLPLLPPLVILSALGWTSSVRPRRLPWLGAGVLSLSLLHAFLYSVAYVGLFVRQNDSRTVAARVVAEVVQPGDLIAFPEPPWYTTPPVVPYNGGMKTFLLLQADPRGPNGSKVCVLQWDMGELERRGPDFVVVGDHMIRDVMRLSHHPKHRWNEEVQHKMRFWAEVKKKYRLLLHLRRRPEIWGLTFCRGHVPHDWLYPMPDVWVWAKGEIFGRRS